MEIDFDNDFGFSLVSEDEIDAVQKAKSTVQQTSETASSTQEKLDKLYNAITPLLKNLKKNPEKPYIKWPDRLEKVEQFEELIQKIYTGD